MLIDASQKLLVMDIAATGSAYDCNFPTEVILDLSRLDGIWCLIGDDMVQLCGKMGK